MPLRQTHPGHAVDYDRSLASQYTPGVTGAGGGQLNIGQLSRNAATFTHGSTVLFTNGLERLRINSAGNVGIGTSIPGHRLDVVGAVNTSGGLCIAGDCKTAWSQVGGSGGSSQWTTSGSNIHYTNGNVGIGTSVAPAAKLHVQGDVRVTTNLVVDGNIAAKYQDLAEWVPAAEQLARLLHNHVRLLLAASVMLLLAAASFMVPRTEGAAPVFANEPVNLVVTANSNNSITLGWTAPAGGGVAHYRVERSESVSGPFGFIATAATASFNDTTVTIQRAYLYRVRAVLTNGCQSEPSNMALGTAITFEFNQLANQQVKAQHFHDVRTAINAVRAVANLAPASWTRPTLNNLQIMATDVLEVRKQVERGVARTRYSSR